MPVLLSSLPSDQVISQGGTSTGRPISSQQSQYQPNPSLQDLAHYQQQPGLPPAITSSSQALIASQHPHAISYPPPPSAPPQIYLGEAEDSNYNGPTLSTGQGESRPGTAHTVASGDSLSMSHVWRLLDTPTAESPANPSPSEQDAPPPPTISTGEQGHIVLQGQSVPLQLRQHTPAASQSIIPPTRSANITGAKSSATGNAMQRRPRNYNVRDDVEALHSNM